MEEGGGKLGREIEEHLNCEGKDLAISLNLRVVFIQSSSCAEEWEQCRISKVIGPLTAIVASQAIRNVRSLEQYAAVVLGTPLYITRFHRDARRFLAANRDPLEKVPVALFVLGPAQMDEKDWIGAQNQLQKELLDFPWFSPVSQKVFGGKFDPAKLGFPFNLIPALRRMPASDVRDWVAIREWAVGLASILLPMSHTWYRPN